MDLAPHDHWTELAADVVGASAMGIAAGYAASAILGLPPMAAALTAFSGVFLALRHVTTGGHEYQLPAFEIVKLPESEQPEELLLTPEMIAPAPAGEAIEELLLDDVLAKPEPRSRVVRLFDPRQEFSPAELRTSIDRHVSASGASHPPDATQALNDALAQLRRSLH